MSVSETKFVLESLGFDKHTKTLSSILLSVFSASSETHTIATQLLRKKTRIWQQLIRHEDHFERTSRNDRENLLNQADGTIACDFQEKRSCILFLRGYFVRLHVTLNFFPVKTSAIHTQCIYTSARVHTCQTQMVTQSMSAKWFPFFIWTFGLLVSEKLDFRGNIISGTLYLVFFYDDF